VQTVEIATLFYALLMAFDAHFVYTCMGGSNPTKYVYTRRRAESMDMQTILVITPVLALVCIIGLAVIFRRRKSRRLSRRIVATITRIEVEATSVSSGWVVTAQWSEMPTGQTITFRSHRLQFPPRQNIGGPVTVDVDPRNPTHYRMEL
jgi:glucan phosphoethanolaminetransferase (alkaline phosphatase superfamily)